VVVVVITAVMAVATHRGSVATAAPRGSSLVVAVVLPVTLGALDERRLVGTVSGILPGYSCKEGRRVEDGLLVEFPY
jgi:hypothetical protein